MAGLIDPESADIPGDADGPAAHDRWAIAPQRSLPDMIAEKILAAVRRGEIRPGERLPESHLAARLGVSRGPLREALRMLEASHIVESRRGRGTCVRDISVADMAHMIPVRASLEGLAARILATYADETVSARLEHLHAQIETAARSGETAVWRSLDWSFHEFVCKSAHNPFLFAGWRSIGTLVLLFLQRHDAFEVDAESVIRNHRDLVDAILSGDPDHAEYVFRTTILRASFASLGMQVPAGAMPTAGGHGRATEEEPALEALRGADRPAAARPVRRGHAG